MADIDRSKRELQELIESRKLKQSTADGGAGLGEPLLGEPVFPRTFKEKWANYWYHYKLLTFGIAFAAIITISFVGSIIFKTKYDAYLTIASLYPYDTLVQTIVKEITPFTTEATGNDKIDIAVFPIQIDFEGKYGGTPELMQANVAKLMGQVSTMESFIYLLDDTAYEYILEMGLPFLDLSGTVSPDRLSQDNKLYSIKDSALTAELDMGTMFDELNLCIVDFDQLGESQKKNKKIVTAYERDKALFDKIVEFIEAENVI